MSSELAESLRAAYLSITGNDSFAQHERDALILSAQGDPELEAVLKELQHTQPTGQECES